MRLREQLLSGVAAGALVVGWTMPVEAAPPPAIVAPSWTGFYVGGHVGYSWGTVDGDITHDVVVPAGPPFFAAPPGALLFPGLSRDINPRGSLGGLQAGYNVQSVRAVYGVEADISWTGQRDTFIFSGRRVNFPPNSQEDLFYDEALQAKLRYFGTVRGRWGYAYDQWLPYVTGGFAWGVMQADLSWRFKQQNFSTPAAFSGSESHTLFGWTVGAGFEYAFAREWSAKVEYLYIDLGKHTYFSGIQGGGEFGLRDHILRVGVNFRR